MLFLDADEQLTPAGRAEIRAALTAPIADDTPVGYWLPRQTSSSASASRAAAGGPMSNCGCCAVTAPAMTPAAKSTKS